VPFAASALKLSEDALSEPVPTGRATLLFTRTAGRSRWNRSRRLPSPGRRMSWVAVDGDIGPADCTPRWGTAGRRAPV